MLGRLAPTVLTAEQRELRAQVREFLATELPAHGYRPGLGIAGEVSREFSRVVGARGWIGLTLPESLGGHGRGAVDRFLVVEELLAVGAPTMGHYGSDRQIGPSLAAFGTDEQRRTLIPRIVDGTLFFALGMSEPDAGSDLAGLRTRATPVEGGWCLNGRKIWTSGADQVDVLVVLCRTGDDADRHAGLSQLLVDVASAGVEIRPIEFVDGSYPFCEVSFTDVFVPASHVLGEVGAGWTQITSELAFERSGPDRFTSVQPVLEALVRDELPMWAAEDERGPRVNEALGTVVSRLWAIRQLSLSVSREFDHGRVPKVEAALVKELGTTFEQDAVARIEAAVGTELSLSASSEFESLLAQAAVTAPSFTLRGGTNEVLRGIAARALEPVGGRLAVGEPQLQDAVERMLTAPRPSSRGWHAGLWEKLTSAGALAVGVDVAAGGSGGELADALAVLSLAGYHTAPGPFAETLVAGWLAARSGVAVPDGVCTLAQGRTDDRVEIVPSGSARRVWARLHRVPWARHCDRIVVAAGPDRLLVLPLELARIEPGENLAREPRDLVVLDGVDLAHPGIVEADSPVPPAAVRAQAALLRAAMIGGAAQAAVDLAIEHSRTRRQFGRPIGQFQAMQHLLVTAAGEAALVSMAVAAAAIAPEDRMDFVSAAAKVVAGQAARTVAAACHQIHGAVGMTAAHPLSGLTCRLRSWAVEYGDAAEWARELGLQVTERPGRSVWSQVTGGE